MQVKWKILFLLTVSASLAACGAQDGDPSGDEPTSSAELALGVELDDEDLETDVAGFEFIVTQVDCGTGEPDDPPVSQSAFENLEELYLPGGNDEFIKEPYLPGSKHEFSDHLFVVDTGCYKIVAQPLNEDKEPSEDCAAAVLENEEVADASSLYEYHLISQCRGRARTTLDIIGSLNRPPEAELDIQKFVCAGGGVHVCATAFDPDGDPVRIKFFDDQKDKIDADPQEYDSDTGKTTRCATIPAEEAETKEYTVIVKDLGWDGSKKVPIETLLPTQEAEWDDANKSRAKLKFPVHGIDDCKAGAMAFIGTTLGAKLEEKNGKLAPDDTRGMSEAQAKQLATNAVNWVNPNLWGDEDPRILLVLDDADTEDQEDADYIEQLLDDQGFTDVTRVDESDPGIPATDVVGYKIVWLVNPGYPIDDELTFDTLKDFRLKGGGVIVSGDDATQAADLGGDRDMIEFSFLEYLNDNGTTACGVQTDNNTGKNYIVDFVSDTPLTAGLSGSFRYGNDIDKAVRVGQAEIVAATTSGVDLDGSGALEEDNAHGNNEYCLDPVRDVMTAVPSGEIYGAP